MAAETLKDKRFVERALATTPLQKVATPEDVARQIAVLASPVLSGHMTGVNIQVGEYDLLLANLIVLMCFQTVVWREDVCIRQHSLDLMQI